MLNSDTYGNLLQLESELNMVRRHIVVSIRKGVNAAGEAIYSASEGRDLAGLLSAEAGCVERLAAAMKGIDANRDIPFVSEYEPAASLIADIERG